MAKVPTIEARVANYVLDDLKRRHAPIDGLLKEVGLRRIDLADPEARLQYASVLSLIERAATLVGDHSFGLRLGASRDTRERGLLGFLILNSPTLMDALTNLQRYSRVAGESEDIEIERTGGQIDEPAPTLGVLERDHAAQAPGHCLDRAGEVVRVADSDRASSEQPQRRGEPGVAEGLDERERERQASRHARVRRQRVLVERDQR